MGNKIRHSTKPDLKDCISAKTEAAKNVVDIKRDAADLYSLAFLLTGRQDISIDIAADAAVSEDNPNSFFADWMRDWRRRLVIGKALTAIRDELADSARRTKLARVGFAAAWQRNWSTRPVVTEADLECALLAIDIFPRAALLLLIFEGMRIADAATLLDADPALVKKAQVIGLHELTASLAPTKPDPVSGLPQSLQGSRRV
jgi:DNA-directed RNA polymerase specialized sigma24 family protein